MIWHILAIIFGALAALSTICPTWYSEVVFGVLVVIFASLALRSFREAKRKIV
jgi:succinate-acetate transporter protein